jgi:hypothetical protein
MSTGFVDEVKWDDELLEKLHVAAFGDLHVQMDGEVYVGRQLFPPKSDLPDRITECIV